MLITEKMLSVLVIPLFIVSTLNMIDSKHYKKKKIYTLLFTYLVCLIPGFLFYFGKSNINVIWIAAIEHIMYILIIRYFIAFNLIDAIIIFSAFYIFGFTEFISVILLSPFIDLTSPKDLALNYQFQVYIGITTSIIIYIIGKLINTDSIIVTGRKYPKLYLVLFFFIISLIYIPKTLNNSDPASRIMFLKVYPIVTLSMFLFLYISTKLLNSMNKYFELHNKYLNMITLLTEIKATQHDHSNILNILMASHNEVKQGLASSTFSTKVLEINDLIRFRIPIFVNYLEQFELKCSESNISFEYYNELSELYEIPIEEYHLLRIVDNLLINAYNALMKNDNNLDKNIRCTIFNDIDSLRITVENSGNIDLANINKVKSSKVIPNRGYGLENVKKLVKKYHGHIEIYSESGIVTISVLFPFDSVQ